MPPYNGVYAHDSTHEGWPVLKNANGSYCYRHTPDDQWMLTDDKAMCSAFIEAKEGPLPVGANTWQVLSGEWGDGTLTVGLLVRRPLPSLTPSRLRLSIHVR